MYTAPSGSRGSLPRGRQLLLTSCDAGACACLCAASGSSRLAQEAFTRGSSAAAAADEVPSAPPCLASPILCSSGRSGRPSFARGRSAAAAAEEGLSSPACMVATLQHEGAPGGRGGLGVHALHAACASSAQRCSTAHPSGEAPAQACPPHLTGTFALACSPAGWRTWLAPLPWLAALLDGAPGWRPRPACWMAHGVRRRPSSQQHLSLSSMGPQAGWGGGESVRRG